MTEQISVDKAINKGRFIWMIFILTMIAILTFALLSLGKSIVIFFILFFSAIVIPTFIIVLLLKKWKYWAFKNVRNVHELKKRAIQARLIEDKDKLFERIEKSTEKDTVYWDIKQKFLQTDVFIDDLSVPEETNIYHSKPLIYFYLFIFLFVIIGSAYLFFDNIMMCLITAIVGTGFFLYINRDKLNREKPIIRIDDTGIETNNLGFTSWKNIRNDNVYTIGAGNSTKCYMTYEFDEEKVTVCLTGLNIGIEKMGKLLILYRNRFNQRTNNNS